MQDLARDIAVNTPITREEAARLTTRALLITEPDLKPVLASANPIYLDRYVMNSICSLAPDWFYITPEYRQDVVAEYFAGIMQGDENYLFNPQKNLTRAEAATIMRKLANKDERRNTDNLSFEMWDIIEQANTESSLLVNGRSDRDIEIPEGLMKFMIEEWIKNWWYETSRDANYARLCKTIGFAEEYITTGDCPNGEMIRSHPDYYIHYLPILKEVKEDYDAGLLDYAPNTGKLSRDARLTGNGLF